MQNIVIIGSGAAGMTAASEAKRYDPSSNVTVFTEDEHIAYSPCAIPWVVEGKMEWKDIVMHDARFYEKERGITVHTKTKVTAADGQNKTVTACGKEYAYDSLVIATGGKVFVPPVPGNDLDGIFAVRTVNDAIAIRDASKSAKRIAVIGAGVIGLEMAAAFRNIGKDVLVVEMFDQVIPRICDNDISQMVLSELESKGIRFLFKTPLGSVNGSDKVKSITANGREYECDMVIFATGVRADLEIPKMLGLDIGILGAVAASPTMRPYSKGRLVNDVFVAGDVVQSHSAAAPGPTMSQLGSSAVKQGIVAGKNAAGGNFSMGATASPWISEIGDIQVGGAGISCGLAAWYGIRTAEGIAEGSTNARYYPGGKKITIKLIGDPSSRRIIGAQMVSRGNINGHVNWLSSVISGNITVDSFLMNGENAYCPPTSMVRDTAFDAAERLLNNI